MNEKAEYPLLTNAAAPDHPHMDWKMKNATNTTANRRCEHVSTKALRTGERMYKATYARINQFAEVMQNTPASPLIDNAA